MRNKESENSQDSPREKSVGDGVGSVWKLIFKVIEAVKSGFNTFSENAKNFFLSVKNAVLGNHTTTPAKSEPADNSKSQAEGAPSKVSITKLDIDAAVKKAETRSIVEATRSRLSNREGNKAEPPEAERSAAREPVRSTPARSGRS